MAPDFSVIEGKYFCDILSQPKAIEDTLASLTVSKPLQQLAAKLRRGKFKTIILTGMGSSFHALHPLQINLIEHGHCALMVETSELIYYHNGLFRPDTLIVAVSQSGHTVEMIRLMKLNRRRAAILAITNTADSPLAVRSDAAIVTRAGQEYSVSCKTYLCALLALQFAGEVLCGGFNRRTNKELSSVIPAVSGYLANWQEHLQSLREKLTGVRTLFLVGRGVSLASAGTGALIIKESNQVPAEGMSSASFRHGPFEMLGPEMFVLVFAGDSRTSDLNKRLYEDACEQKARTGWISENSGDSAFNLPRTPLSVLPVLQILPVQMITLALAWLAGREPGKFRLATKITTTE